VQGQMPRCPGRCPAVRARGRDHEAWPSRREGSAHRARPCRPHRRSHRPPGRSGLPDRRRVGCRAVIVLDTHAWLWWAGDHERLPRRLRRRLAADDDLVISAIDCWEAAMLVQRGRLTLAPDARSGIRRATTVPNLRVMDVTEAIATDAGLLGAAFHGDPADRIVVEVGR